MTDLSSLLERADHAVSGVPLPTGDLERLRSLRDRKRRNQRIAAGVVGIAVFVAAVGLVVVGGSFDRTQSPALPGPTAVTGPSVPPDPDGGSSIGLPPEGADPSSPERGELVITFYGRPASESFSSFTPVLQVLVYADGRVVWRQEWGPKGANGITTGFLEQRLTPEGVELLGSEVISSGLFDRNHHFDEGWGGGLKNGLIWGEIGVDDGDRFVSVRWGGAVGRPNTPTTPEQGTALRHLNLLFSDLASMLPANAWEDPEVKAYVPSRYAICYQRLRDELIPRPLEPSEVLNLLPTPAEDLLRGRYEPFEGVGWRAGCSGVTTEEARTLDVILTDGGFERHQTSLTTGDYSFLAPDPNDPVEILFAPILPHGQWSLFPG